MKLRISLTLLLLAVAFLVPAALAQDNATTNDTANQTSLSELVQAALSDKNTAIVMLIEFALGFGLGYTAVKALKYIMAFIGILMIGSALSVWSFGSSDNRQLIEVLGEEFKKLLPLLKSFLTAFSIVVVGPTSIGIIAGILVAMLMK